MPKTLSEPEYVTSAIAAAARVPFPGDTRASRGRIDVLLDDGDRESLAACGAAVLNIQLALRASGHAATVDLLPDHTRPGLVAVVWIRATCVPSYHERALARAIPALREHHGPFAGGPVPQRVRTALVHAAAREEAELALLEPAAAVGTLKEQLSDSDGLVAVLSSHTDTARGQLQAGRALQRVLLTSSVHGAQAAVLLRPDAVQKARPELRGFLGCQVHPQAVLEFGYAPPAPPKQRRRR
ncbi:hypothetical protein [Amycolatopsis alkalitolerans]|uniref:Uncharacterized protein n=1 Tax=Amycolatopsis alkalitolerans TaxID=2547244 RepID=A0A5C4LVX4_9PSEU|nr:hypothetical protein [Amycolatopsis alkalitolerans]TNC23533.1 hypothetical protein FG385_21130 [Amycolatopsis alkalitolerans]